MSEKLTEQQVLALESLPPGRPLELIDEVSNKTYILFEKEAYEAWVDRQLQRSFDDVAHGRVTEWNLDEMKRLVRERRSERAES